MDRRSEYRALGQPTFGKRNPCVERVCLYEWRAPTGDVSWDSGAASPDHKPLPAYGIVKKHLCR